MKIQVGDLVMLKRNIAESSVPLTINPFSFSEQFVRTGWFTGQCIGIVIKLLHADAREVCLLAPMAMGWTYGANLITIGKG